MGREHAIDEVAGLLGRPEVRLVALTGLGGSARRAWHWLSPNCCMTDLMGSRSFPWKRPPAKTSPAGIARAVGAGLAGTDSPLQVLVEQLGDGRWLLILDNLEQVLDVAGDLGELLVRCPHVAILVTIRNPTNTDRTIPGLENIAEVSDGVRYASVGSAMMCSWRPCRGSAGPS